MQEDSGTVCEVSQERQEKEEERETCIRPLALDVCNRTTEQRLTCAGLLLVVTNDLRNASSQVQHSTDVPQDLGPHGHVVRAARGISAVLGLPGARPPGEYPSKRTNRDDTHNGESIPDDRRIGILILVQDGNRQRVPSAAASGCHRAPPAFSGRNQWLRRVIAEDTASSARAAFLLCRDAVVVNRLANEHYIGEAEVHGDRDDGG